MVDNWFEMYPIIGMISLTSGLLLLCSFVRRKPKVKPKGNLGRSPSTSTVTSINLLTNEDSAKVFRHGTSGNKSLSKSGHSISADHLTPAEVVIKIEAEPPKVKSKEKIQPKPQAQVEKKKSKTSSQTKIKENGSSSDNKDSDNGVAPCIMKKNSTSSIHSVQSVRSIRSVISAIDSEPEISTIRTIYKSKTKRPVKSIISRIDSDELSKSTED